MKSRWTNLKRARAPKLTTSKRRWTGTSFTNQVLAQIDLLKNTKENKGYKNQVYLLPKDLDEKVARLHLPALGAELTVLSKDQADYIGVPESGPYKPDTYRY